MLIGIAGCKRNGKNTICEIISSVKNDSAIVFSFAEPIRKIGEVFGFSREEMTVDKEKLNGFWNISWRRFAQMVGTEMFRKVFRQDVWIRLAEKSYFENSGKTVLFDDIRFDNEAEFIRAYNGYVIRVSRPCMNPVKSKYAIVRFVKRLFLHDSEKSISDYLVDYDIVNDGTIEDLKVKVLGILEDIEKNSKVPQMKNFVARIK